METRKLYYEDCHLAEFTATVMACEKTDGGWLVELDRTAFYPEGGGQAADVGTLGNVSVVHTFEEGERVLHLCDGPLTPGETVEGKIDYVFRFDQMQQHTGEHILSGLVYEKYGWHNTGFHMGVSSVTVDFDGIIPPEDIPELERQLNEALWQDIPLEIWTPSPEELPTVFYRTKRALPWPVRVVRIPGYDSCACCGIHVARTGEVGLAKIFSCIRFRTGSRIEMLCGRRCLDYLSRNLEQNRQVSQAFSVPVLETGAAARAMNDTLGQMKYRISVLEMQIFETLAEACRDKGDVLIIRDGLDAVLVRKLADRVAELSGGTAAVFSGSDETGYSYCLVSRTADLRPLGKAVNAALNGRGGGKPACIQGSVRATKAAVLAHFVQFSVLENS